MGGWWSGGACNACFLPPPHPLLCNPAALNLRAYAVLGRDKTFRITLINKEHGPGRRDAQVNLVAGNGCSRGQVMLLATSAGDVQAKSGTTLGGSAIGHDGSWRGEWTPLAAPSASGQFHLKVPAASAAIVKLAIDK